MPPHPAYKLADFIKACRDKPDTVIVLKEARADAEAHFNLRTQAEIIRFVGSDGLQQLEIENSAVYERDPRYMADSYSFYTGRKHGYIAFVYASVTHKWLIKSFKPNSRSMVNQPFEMLLRSAGLLSEKGGDK